MKYPLIAALLAVVLVDPAAHAQRRRRTSAPAPTTRTAEAPVTLPEEPPEGSLPDTDALIAAIQTAAVSNTAESARSISLLMLRGLPPRAAAAGLDALAVLARPEGTVVVQRFLEHRRPLLRRHAIGAAQAIHTPALVRALAERLSDPDEDVRMEAATALAEVGTQQEVAELFLAFDRDLSNTIDAQGGRLAHSAAQAIARKGDAPAVQRLLGYLRRAPFRTVADAMRSALARPDLPEPLKVRIVASIGDLATREAREFLTAFATGSRAPDGAVVRAARTAADRIAE